MKKKGRLLLAFITVAVLVMVFGFTALAYSEKNIIFNDNGIELEPNSDINLENNVVNPKTIINIYSEAPYTYKITVDGNDQSLSHYTEHTFSLGEKDTILYYTGFDVDGSTVTVKFVTTLPTPVTPELESIPAPEPEKPAWKPTTKEEIYQCSLKQSTPPVVETNDETTKVVNEVQGTACLAVFENVCETTGFTMGSTFNIFEEGTDLNGTPAYTFKDGQARTSIMTIPENLRKEGRTFMMVCVSEDGKPYTYKDTDSDPNTITFTYDRLYAFALVYKD